MAQAGSSFSKTTTALEGSTTPEIFNLSAPTANTEVSQALPTGTKQLLIRVRARARAQFSFVSGESSTKYITIRPGTVYKAEGLKLTGQTLYIQTDAASQTIEIETWR